MVKFQAKILKNKKTNQHSVNIPSHLIKYKHITYDPNWIYHIEITKEVPVSPKLDIMDEMKEKHFSDKGEIKNLKTTGLPKLSPPPSFLTYKPKVENYLETEREYFSKKLKGEIKDESKEARFENYLGDPIVKEDYDVIIELEKQLGSIPKIIPSLSVGPHHPRFGYIAVENRVVELILYNKGLKILPDIVGKMKYLHKLDLRRNNLTTIPNSIGMLINLQELLIEENQLVSLPESIGELVNLQKLYLFNNKLKNIPETIPYLPNLFELDLSDNFLTIDNKNIRKVLEKWASTLNNSYIDLFIRRDRPKQDNFA